MSSQSPALERWPPRYGPDRAFHTNHPDRQSRGLSGEADKLHHLPHLSRLITPVLGLHPESGPKTVPLAPLPLALPSSRSPAAPIPDASIPAHSSLLRSEGQAGQVQTPAAASVRSNPCHDWERRLVLGNGWVPQIQVQVSSPLLTSCVTLSRSCPL